MTEEEKGTLAALTDENTQLKAQNEALAKVQRENQVDNAISGGKLAPAKRDFALQLDNNSLGNYLTLEASTFKKTDNNGLQADEHDHNGDADCDVFAQLGLSEGEK